MEDVTHAEVSASSYWSSTTSDWARCRGEFMLSLRVPHVHPAYGSTRGPGPIFFARYGPTVVFMDISIPDSAGWRLRRGIRSDDPKDLHDPLP